MTMTEAQQLSNWIDATVVDREGDKVGKVTAFYMDEATGQPEWIAVKTGLFGNRVSFVPLEDASADGDTLVVPFSTDQVKDAPNVEADGQLSQEEEQALYRHYGMQYSESRSATGLPGDRTPRRGGPGRDTSGPTTDDAMTRSEEELQVGTQSREAGRVRLRKWVETETQTVTVPVARERVRVEREPITDANVDRATDGPEISGEEHEVTLYEEEAVVGKRAVPKERVRLDKDVEVDESTVTEDVRKERIGLDGDERR